MFIKKGDTVKILSGKDRGKTGKVLSVNAKIRRAVVEGANLLTRHERAKKAGTKGQKIQFPAPLDISKLQVVCPHCGKPSRFGVKMDEQGRKMRICKNCGKETK